MKQLLIALAALGLMMPLGVVASAISGTIDPINFSSPFLDNASGLWASSSVSSSIYWNTPAPYEVHVNDNELTGYLWGDTVGWISLNCSNTASCGTQDFKVTNDSEGDLSGYAWGEYAGWISFDCGNPETNNCASNNEARVRINTNGKFGGYAWAENFGWVNFDCNAGSISCVETDWRPASIRSVPSVLSATRNLTKQSGGFRFPIPFATPGPMIGIKGQVSKIFESDPPFRRNEAQALPLPGSKMNPVDIDSSPTKNKLIWFFGIITACIALLLSGIRMRSIWEHSPRL